MEKKLNRPYDRNVRLEMPTGLVGVPPEHPVLIVARLTDRQLEAIVDIIGRSGNVTKFPQ